jgi:hypothetical protein
MMTAVPELKTKVNDADPLTFIGKVKNETKRHDSLELVEMMRDITGEPPKMWGPSIIGFGSYRYRYATGRSGEMCITGFSPRSSALVVYLGPGIDNDKLMGKLGKHKRSKGCLYINKLDDVDRHVLRKLIEYSIKTLRQRKAE